VIKSFRDSNTERVFRRQFVRKLPREIQQRAFMRLNAIDAAVRLEDLMCGDRRLSLRRIYG
jgi:proteic killer suppression protein